jgi:hypothetical protein
MLHKYPYCHKVTPHEYLLQWQESHKHPVVILYYTLRKHVATSKDARLDTVTWMI